MITINEQQYSEYQTFHGLFPLDPDKRKVFDAAYPEYRTQQVEDCPKGRLLIVTIVRVGASERRAHGFDLFTTSRTRMMVGYESVSGLSELLHQRWKEKQIPQDAVIAGKGTALWRQITAYLKAKNFARKE